MNYPACIALMICSLTIVMTAGFLPFLNSDFRKEKRPKFPLWTVVIAAVAVFGSFAALARLRLGQTQVFDALGLTTAMIAGLCLKWTTETVAQRKFTIHEGVLFRALLAAPLAIVIVPVVFGIRPTPGNLLLWFLNGFFWHTLFSDIERLATKEPIVIRRREPPTLPYDFRRPKVD